MLSRSIVKWGGNHLWHYHLSAEQALVLAAGIISLRPAPMVLIAAAIALRLTGGAGYWWQTVMRRVRPNATTWLLWGLAPVVVFVAQLHAQVGAATWITLALALGPVAIGVTALVRCEGSRWPSRFDVLCGALALTGLVFWCLTHDPLLAIGFSIGGDIAASLPTLRKAWRDPDSEPRWPYACSMASMAVTLSSLTDWSYTSWLYPAYMLGINLAVYGAIVLGGVQGQRRLAPA